MPKTISTKLAVEGESEYKRALSDVNRELKTLESELEKVSSDFRDNADSMEALTAKGETLNDLYEKQQEKIEMLQEALQNAQDAHDQYGQQINDLNDQIAENEAKLEELRQSEEDTTSEQQALTDATDQLKQQLEDAQAGFEASGRAVEDWQQKLNYAQIESNKLQDEIDKNNAAMNGSGEASDNAGKGLDAVSGIMGSVSGSAGALTGMLGGLAAGGMMGVIDAATQVVEAMIQMAMSFDEANSIIVEKTGASGEALEEFNQIARDVSLVVDNTDLTGVASAVGELNTRLDLEGEALRRATYLAQQYADVTGSDAESAVVALSKVMKNWNVDASDMESLMDKITVAGQKTGISAEELANSLTLNKVQLQEMGFSLDESIAMLSNFEKEGINTQRIMTGFNTAVAKWSTQGISAREGFAQLTESIKNASSETEAISLATEAFGRRSAQELVFAIQSGRFEFDELTTAIENSNGALLTTEEQADTFSEKAETFVNALGTMSMSGQSLAEIYDQVQQNADAMGVSVGDAIAQFLGLQEAQQAEIDQYPELDEKYKQEQEQLRKQAELEKEAAGGYNQISKNMDSIAAKISTLNEQYSNNYNNAYQAISGQIGLFEDMTTESGVAIEDMIGSLKSQVKYMDNYASNMRRAAELGIDEGLLAKLSDGSKESAQYLQAIVDDGGKHVGELNTELAKVEEGKKTFSTTFATIQTDFDKEMGKIEARMGLAVNRLDQYKEAYKNADDTVQGYINGANARYNDVYKAYERMAQAAQRAVKKTNLIASPSKVMKQYGEYMGEGYALGALEELPNVERAYSKMAEASLRPFENIDPFGAPAAGYVSEGAYNDNRVLDVHISVASGSPEDMQQVYDYISREFATRSGRKMS